MTTSLRTTRKLVLDFDQAIKQGMCRDQNDNKHIIRGHGDQFLITAFEGQEYCFDRRGIQVGAQTKTVKLLDPGMAEVSLLPYLIYNTRSLEIVSQHTGVMSASIDMEKAKDPDLKLLNVTNATQREAMESLGIQRHRWHEHA